MRLLPSVLCLLTAASAQDPRISRINAVRETRGFAALWDFVQRDALGRFEAHLPRPGRYGFSLDAANYVRDYWNLGRPATYENFPLLGRGPFGQAVAFRPEPDPDFRPVLLLPRDRFHDSALDAKGKGRSVSMVVWLVRTGGNHAIAGIWHEGTDLVSSAAPVQRVERGRRQYALFAGLAANNGAAAVHVSENGAASFSDRYARNLAVTPELIPTVSPTASLEQIDAAWSTVAFSFDNARNTVTAYLNGSATELWIDNPEHHPFFRWPARGWLQAELARQPGLQDGEDPAFPRDQFFQPPEQKPLRTTVESESPTGRTELREYPYTRVRVTLAPDARARWTVVRARRLAALKANPFFFPHDLYTPPEAAAGGPFTIGRVIHTSRGVGFTGWIGAVAVFGRALSSAEMLRLARIAPQPLPAPTTSAPAPR